MGWTKNPFTDELDNTTTDIDQIRIGDADTYFKWVAPDTLQLIVNGSVRQSWTTQIMTGIPNMAFGGNLAFTYP